MVVPWYSSTMVHVYVHVYHGTYMRTRVRTYVRTYVRTTMVVLQYTCYQWSLFQCDKYGIRVRTVRTRVRTRTNGTRVPWYHGTIGTRVRTLASGRYHYTNTRFAILWTIVPIMVHVYHGSSFSFPASAGSTKPLQVQCL
jgi:hypothetical protein